MTKKLIVDCNASHNFMKEEKHLHRNRTTHDGNVATAGDESIMVRAKGENETNEEVKLVPKMGKRLLSIGQLPKKDTTVKFKGGHCVIQTRN